MRPRWFWITTLLTGVLLRLAAPARAEEPPSLPAIPGLAEALGLPEIPRFPGTPDTQVHLDQQLIPPSPHALRTPLTTHAEGHDPLFRNVPSLTQRLTELRRQRDSLDNEIKNLEAALAGKSLIQVDVRIIDLDWLRLRRLGMPLFSLQELCAQPCPAGLVLPDESVPRMLEVMQMQQIARELSHRQLVNPLGTPVRIPLEAFAPSALNLATAGLTAPEELRFACDLSDDESEVRFRFTADAGSRAAEAASQSPGKLSPERLNLNAAIGTQLLVVASSRPAEQPDRSVLVLIKPVDVRTADEPQPQLSLHP